MLTTSPIHFLLFSVTVTHPRVPHPYWVKRHAGPEGMAESRCGQVYISVYLGSYICSGYGSIRLRSVCPAKELLEGLFAHWGPSAAAQDSEEWVSVAGSDLWAQLTWMGPLATPC